MTAPLAAALLLGVVLLYAVPRLLVRRSQDRLARELIERLEGGGRRHRLLTRAELSAGRYRRLPGVLGLTDGDLSFHGLFGETIEVPTPGIRKIETGTRLLSGRILLRREVLRVSPSTGDPFEFVLTVASASAWRSHLGLWAMKERESETDRVVPGRPSVRERQEKPPRPEVP